MTTLTPQQALDHIRAGDDVHIWHIDPVTPNEPPAGFIFKERGVAYEMFTEGWSAGVLERVCHTDSPFLLDFLTNAPRLELRPR